MLKLLLTLVMAAGVTANVAGCALAGKYDAQSEYQASLRDYRECIKKATRAGECARERQLVYVNQKAYNTLAAGVGMGSINTFNVNDD